MYRIFITSNLTYGKLHWLYTEPAIASMNSAIDYQLANWIPYLQPLTENPYCPYYRLDDLATNQAPIEWVLDILSSGIKQPEREA
jgi:hypothetical protein